MDDLRNKILSNTIKVFNKKGLKLTMDDIAEQMGISKKTIYKYFDSKEDIFDQIVDYIFDGIKDREKEILNEEGLTIEERTRRQVSEDIQEDDQKARVRLGADFRTSGTGKSRGHLQSGRGFHDIQDHDGCIDCKAF